MKYKLQNYLNIIDLMKIIYLFIEVKMLILIIICFSR